MILDKIPVESYYLINTPYYWICCHIKGLTSNTTLLNKAYLYYYM